MKKHSDKIFKFVSEKSAGEHTLDLLRAVNAYIFQTFTLTQQEIMEIVNNIPEEAAIELASTYNVARAEGREEGILIGTSISKQETEIRKDWELVLKLMKEFPDWTVEKMADFVKVEKEKITKMQSLLAKSEEKELKAFARSLFQHIPNIQESNLIECENWLLELWKKHHKKPSKT